MRSRMILERSYVQQLYCDCPRQLTVFYCANKIIAAKFVATVKAGMNPHHRLRRILYFAVCLVSFFGITTCSVSAEPANFSQLRDSLQNPPPDSRIMMRWWWFGPAVQNEELERELRAMKQGGMGGVELQVTYPLSLDDPEHKFQNVPFLSDSFLN